MKVIKRYEISVIVSSRNVMYSMGTLINNTYCIVYLKVVKRADLKSFQYIHINYDYVK